MDYLLGDPVGQLWLMVGVALLFVGAVQGMLFIGRKGTLWYCLAQEFRPRKKPSGPRITGCSGRLLRAGQFNEGGTRYGGVLRFDVTDTHLHLSILRFFRLGHPPMAMPWSRITGRIVFVGGWKTLELKIRSNYEPVLRLRYEKSGDRLLAAAGDKLRMVDGESLEGESKNDVAGVMSV